MERNRKILAVCQLIVAIALIVSLSAVIALRLDRPVFIENYKDLRVYPTNGYYHADYLTLSYLANNTDDRKVTAVSFQGAEDLEVISYENDPQAGQRIGRYTLRTVQMIINGQSDETKGLVRTLGKATVQFSDGTAIDADLGRIAIYAGSRDDRLKRMRVSSSSDGYSDMEYQATEDLTIIGLESESLGIISEVFDIRVNDIPIDRIEGTEIKEGQRITVSVRNREDGFPYRAMSSFSLTPILRFTDSSGTVQTETLDFISRDVWNMDKWNVLLYLKARGEL